ncbi:MAG: DUF1598 domain-containing protein [Planctomycetia bacterium]|nr:DUF1598 domain-containing protein [Planctomycetia bacterium]
MTIALRRLVRAGVWAAALLTVTATMVALPKAVYAQGGVLVDAEGVMKIRRFDDPHGMLHQQRVAAARAGLEQKLAHRSELRKVSLTLLEAAITDSLDHNRQLSDAMRHLAGLTRIQYIFFYPETNDIVLAGPAEGWVDDLSGRTVGIDSGRPTLLLEDLIVALRAYGPSNKRAPILSCSIDPTPEGLRDMRTALERLGANVQPSDAPRIAEMLKTSLGLQKVSIGGISSKTHFAQVLVEADYRMKLIGIGLENPAGVGIGSYVGRANPSAIARNALKRWYFTPNYECVRMSEDGLAAELVGDGVKLIGEDEVVGADGARHGGGAKDPASTAFTQAFTKRYGKLAAKVPVYGQLRNCIDLAVAAAHIRTSGWCERAGWQMLVFDNEERYAVETHHAPVQVETAVNVVWKTKNQFSTPIGGGVTIQANLALQSANKLADTDGQVQKAREQVKPPKLAKGQWWWD